MIKDNKFDCPYDEVLFLNLELLAGKNVISYEGGDFNEDACINLNKAYHIQLGSNYVILWVKKKEIFEQLFVDNDKSIFDIERIINKVDRLKIF